MKHKPEPGEFLERGMPLLEEEFGVSAEEWNEMSNAQQKELISALDKHLVYFCEETENELRDCLTNIRWNGREAA